MEEARKVMNKRLKVLQKAYTNYRNNPFNPDYAHEIRTNSRKLRSMFNFMKDSMDEADYDHVNNSLRDFAFIYGPVREIDVLNEWCTVVATKEPELSNEYKELFNHFTKERRREMNRTFNKTNTLTSTTALDDASKAIEQLSFKKTKKLDKDIKKQLQKKEEKLLKNFENLNLEDYEGVHELRKEAKKLRYPAEDLGKLSSVKHKKIASKAEDIQDDLGQLTDAEVNIRLLNCYAEKTDNEALNQLFLDLAEIQKQQLPSK